MYFICLSRKQTQIAMRPTVTLEVVTNLPYTEVVPLFRHFPQGRRLGYNTGPDGGCDFAPPQKAVHDKEVGFSVRIKEISDVFGAQNY